MKIPRPSDAIYYRKIQCGQVRIFHLSVNADSTGLWLIINWGSEISDVD